MATLYDNIRGNRTRDRIIRAIAHPGGEKFTKREVLYLVNHDGDEPVSLGTIEYQLAQLKAHNLVCSRPQYAGLGGYLWFLSKQGWDKYNQEMK